VSERGTAALVVIGLLLAASLPAVAQGQRQPQNVIDRRIAGEANQNPYFTPNEQPFQGSFSRRWQQQLEQMYGGVEAGRGVPPPDNRRIILPPRDLIFYHSPYRVRCDRLGCYRIWQWQRGYRGDSWYNWYGPIR